MRVLLSCSRQRPLNIWWGYITNELKLWRIAHTFSYVTGKHYPDWMDGQAGYHSEWASKYYQWIWTTKLLTGYMKLVLLIY